MELAQVRQEIDRRIAEKEDEFENSRYKVWKLTLLTCYYIYRKNHARAMDSMQASLEAEQHAKAEAVRMKKKIEGDINELEIALDHANKANSEAQKVIVIVVETVYMANTYNPPGHQAVPGTAEGCQYCMRGGAEEPPGGC